MSQSLAFVDAGGPCAQLGEYCGDGQGCCDGLECDGDASHETYDTCIEPDPCANITCPGNQECYNGYCYDALPWGAPACNGQNAHLGDECCTAADCCAGAGSSMACSPATQTCVGPTQVQVPVTCNGANYDCPVYWGDQTGASVWIGGACTQQAAGDLGGDQCPAGGGAYCVYDCAGCCVARGAACQPGDHEPCCDGSTCTNNVCTQCPLEGEYCGDGQGCCAGLECDGDESHPTYDTCITPAGANQSLE